MWHCITRIDNQIEQYLLHLGPIRFNGPELSRKEIGMIKVAAPNMALQVIDWAIQSFGAAGVSDDFALAAMYAHARTLRLADGPDEVHRNQIGNLELRRHG